MAKILITGGAGYIGSMLTEKLLSLNHEVRVLDTLFFGQDGLLPFSRNQGFHFIHGDAADKEVLKKALEGREFVFPLAALVGAKLCDEYQDEATRINLTAIETLCSLLTDSQKVIFPNTNSGYGRGPQGLCTEESELNPISHYAVTKVNAEQFLLKQARAVSLRLATVFGSSYRCRFDLLVNNLVLTALKEKELTIFEGHYRRNFVHVLDVIDAFVFIMENFERSEKQIFNLGLDSANITKWELALKIQEQIPGVQVFENQSSKDPDQRDYLVSNDKLRKHGYEATRSLEDGIREMIKAAGIRLALEKKA